MNKNTRLKNLEEKIQTDERRAVFWVDEVKMEKDPEFKEWFYNKFPGAVSFFETINWADFSYLCSALENKKELNREQKTLLKKIIAPQYDRYLNEKQSKVK